MKVLLFGVCFVATIFASSLVLAQDAHNAGSVQGAPTADGVVCNNPDIPNPYASTGPLVTDDGHKAKALLNEDGTVKPDDGSGIH